MANSQNIGVDRDGDLVDFVVRIWNKTMSEPYYVFHFLLFFSYIPIRCAASNEIQAVVTYFVLIAVKIFLAIIALILDYHLALWYSLVFLGSLNQLTPLQLETLLTEGNTTKFLLVEFCALSKSSCVSTSSFFPELSMTYSNKNLSFGTVDLGLFPNAAEKFGIPPVSLNQLPYYILFENGTEVCCYPEVHFEPKVFGAPLTKKVLCKHFELDGPLLDYVNGK